MLTIEELQPLVSDLYARLGGAGNADARLVRGLYSRLCGAEIKLSGCKHDRILFAPDYSINQALAESILERDLLIVKLTKENEKLNEDLGTWETFGASHGVRMFDENEKFEG